MIISSYNNIGFCIILGTKDWDAIDLSVDGTFIAGVIYDGYIYTSNDFGTNWIEHKEAGHRLWSGIALSNNGQYIASCVYGGYIQQSTNYGETWIELKSSVYEFYRDITSDSTGKGYTIIIISSIVLLSYESTSLVSSLLPSPRRQLYY